MNVGSRIGVIFVPVPHDSDKAQMHFIINGVDHGPCVSDIPYKDTALHAVVDVYGTTKQVKIIQLYESESNGHEHEMNTIEHFPLLFSLFLAKLLS